MFHNSLESEVRDLRRAVESHGKSSSHYSDIREGGDFFAVCLVVGFVIFLLII